MTQEVEDAIDDYQYYDGLSGTENTLGVPLTLAKPIGIAGSWLSVIISAIFLILGVLDFKFLYIIASLLMVLMCLIMNLFGKSENDYKNIQYNFVSEVRAIISDIDVNNFGKTSNYSQKEAEQIVEEMKHEVRVKTLRITQGGKAPLDRLDDNESIQYFLTGFDFDVDGNDEGHRSQLIVTDNRVLMIATSITGKTSEYLVSFSDIIGLSVQRRLTSQIRIQTAGHSYKISAAGSSPELADEVVKYIRGQKEQIEAPPQHPPENNPIEKIERLSELHESGVLTTEQFESKKQDLLDKI